MTDWKNGLLQLFASQVLTVRADRVMLDMVQADSLEPAGIMVRSG